MGSIYMPPLEMQAYAAAISSGVIPLVPSASPGPSTLIREGSTPSRSRYFALSSGVTMSNRILAATMLSEDVMPRRTEVSPSQRREPIFGYPLSPP